MKYLLDTHAVIWYFEDSPELPKKIAELIDNPEMKIFICSVSLWEIAIKVNLGKLKLNITFDDLLNNIKNSDFNILQIENEHLNELSKLPLLHIDPFDRLIISSAISEALTVIANNDNIHKNMMFNGCGNRYIWTAENKLKYRRKPYPTGDGVLTESSLILFSPSI